MQVTRHGGFNYSKSRFGSDGQVENERQLLAEKQKLCKTQARKFSVETNRRRRALHDKQKQWDMEERRLRENVLQRRRQQVQHATERFQRAHLPPSQKYRQCQCCVLQTVLRSEEQSTTSLDLRLFSFVMQAFRRNATNIEDALSQIQATLGSYTEQSSFLSSNSNISRSSTPSPKPSTVSKSSIFQEISALESYTELLQEQIGTEKHKSSQGRHLSDSLSSKDSLDNEDPVQSTINPQRAAYASFFLHYEKSHSDSRKQNELCPTPDLASFAAMPPDANIARSSELHEPEQEDSKWAKNGVDASKGSWGFTSFDETSKTKIKAALRDGDFLTLSEITTGEPAHFKVKPSQNNPSDNRNFINRVVLGTKDVESSYPYQEDLLDLKQQGFNNDRQLSYLSAADIPLPSTTWSSKDILLGSPPKPDHSMKDIKTHNLSNGRSPQQKGKESHYLSLQREPCDTINNLNKVSNLECKTENPIHAASQPHVSLSNIQSDPQERFDSTEEEEKKPPLSVATSHSLCEVRFIKGILKKQLKYISGDATRAHGSGHFIFAKNVALAIRDSVELTRAKKKNIEINNDVKKKLRWFDEVHVGKENITKQAEDKSSSLPPPKINSEDHQLSLTTDSGSPKTGPSMTPAASAGYHFTKEAWTDVGVQVNLPQEQADEVKVPQSSTRSTGPRVPRKERSTRAGAGPVSSQTRRGTVIRAQYATEARQIAKTQGKILVPRPPPRTDLAEEKTPCITRAPYVMGRASIGNKHGQVMEQVPHKNNSEGVFSPNTHRVFKTDSAAIYSAAQQPHSHAQPFSEGDAKNTPVPGHPAAESSRGRGLVKGLCLAATPTDDEISQLWHGVRRALNKTDAKSVLHSRAPQSQQAATKPCAEQSRPHPVPGSSKPLQSSQPTKQTPEPVRSRSGAIDAAFPSEGFRGVAKLHPAEGPSGENAATAAMDSTQTHGPGTLEQHSPQQGLTSISSEEKKLLLSLDRLNHQLHCIQGHVRGNAGFALIDSPFAREAKVTNDLKRRTSSAKRLQYQKKI